MKKSSQSENRRKQVMRQFVFFEAYLQIQNNRNVARKRQRIVQRIIRDYARKCSHTIELASQNRNE